MLMEYSDPLASRTVCNAYFPVRFVWFVSSLYVSTTLCLLSGVAVSGTALPQEKRRANPRAAAVPPQGLGPHFWVSWSTVLNSCFAALPPPPSPYNTFLHDCFSFCVSTFKPNRSDSRSEAVRGWSSSFHGQVILYDLRIYGRPEDHVFFFFLMRDATWA